MIPVLTGVRTFSYIDLDPQTPAPGEVCISVRAISICGSDLRAYRGVHPNIKPPTVLGHEFSGVVSEAGEGVDGLQPGDRVFGDPTLGCGTCRMCAKNRPNICNEYTVIGRSMSRPGAMSGFVVLPTENVHRLPNSVPFGHGALIQPLSVGYHAVAHRSGALPGDSILVAGAGPIGLGVVMAAAEAGMRVLVSEPSEWRRNLALSLGAHQVTDPRKDSLVSAVQSFTDGQGVDATFEAVGNTDGRLLGDLVAATSAGGTVVVLGLKIDSTAVPIRDLKYKEKTVTGSQAHPNSLLEVAKRLEDGRYSVSGIITHEVALSDVARAFSLLDTQDEDVVKIVIDSGDRP